MAASYPTSAASFPTRVNGNTIVSVDHNAPCDEITAVESALLTGLAHWLKAQGVNIGATAAHTISAGVITIVTGTITVDTQGASAADDLDTISVGTPTNGPAIGEGSLLVVACASAARVVTVKDGTGNIKLQGDFVFASTDDRLVLIYTGSQWIELCRATGNGVLTVTGLLDISAAAAGQIKFPATQNPSSNVNTFDDYEEGTWTPVIGGSGGTSGQTYAIQKGWYVKKGKEVTAECYVELSNKGTITTAVEIQGLPFTVENVANQYVGASIGLFQNLATAVSWMGGYAAPNATVIRLTMIVAAGAMTVSELTTADISNTTVLLVKVVYKATN